MMTHAILDAALATPAYDTGSILCGYILGGVLLLTKPNRAKANKLGEVERVYRILRDWLITAKLPPGEFLSEADLAERCGTSRTPVREACTRLMQDHWLTRIRRKGFMVTPISVRDIVDLYEYRKLLECHSAEKLAQTASHDQIRELAAIVAPEKDPEPAWNNSRRQPALSSALV